MICFDRLLADLRALAIGVSSNREAGQTNVEYALILVLVAIAAAAILIIVGQNIAGVLSSVNSSLTNP